MTDNVVHVGDKVEITADISILGIITIHAGSTGTVEAVEDGVAKVRVDGLINISVDAKVDILLKVERS